MLISHPDRTLLKHLEGLKEVTDAVLKEKTQFLFSKEELEYLVLLLIIYHDIGKATDYFQYKIIEITVNAKVKSELYFEKEEFLKSFLNEKYEIGKLIKEREELTYHAELGAYLIQSEWLEEKLNLEHLIMLQVIKRHHNNLQNFKASNFIFQDTNADRKEALNDRFKALDVPAFFEVVQSLGKIKTEYHSLDKILPRFEKLIFINSILHILKKRKQVEPFLKTQFLFSLLLSADKGDVKLKEKKSIFERKNISSFVIEAFKDSNNVEKGKSIDKDRQEAYETVLNNLKLNVDSFFFSITLPTGLGKTFTSYKAALWLKKNHYPNHRIIYCLPFTSIIDQNAALFKAILKHSDIEERWITIHHYLTEIEEKDDENNENDFFQENEYVTEGWQNEIIVTTFVQLLESIFTNRNKKIRKFHNLVNSIIILDEVQNIPPKYYEVIEAVFEGMAKYFNTRFLFVTATQPIIFGDRVIKLAAKKGCKNECYFFNKMERIQLDKSLLKDGEEKEVTEIVSLIKSIFEEGKSVLAIFNTIAQSQEAFEGIRNILPENTKIRYLSAALTPFCRKSIINKIKKDIKSGKKQILISTQVVEAGVDIDFDCVLRDFATMDSINQSAGRCNRNSQKGVSKVILFDCGKSKMVYNGDGNILLDLTRIVLKEYESDIIPEKDIFKLNQRYFQLVKDGIQTENDESRKLLKMVYELQFEELDEAFQLIPYDYPKWSVFVPLTKNAKTVWKKYQETGLISDKWDRKAEVKKLMPKILQYVVSIPEQHYCPSPRDKDKPIIHEQNWKEMYDLETGYKRNSGSSTKCL